MKKIKKLKSRIKLQFACPDYRKVLLRLNQSSKRKWLLLGSPIHDNLGDHLIALAELDYLRSLNSEVDIFDIPTEMVFFYSQTIRESLNPDDIIFINGGGWMGTLWKQDEFFMQQILHLFNNYKIIVFPQTIYYDAFDARKNDVLTSAKEIWHSTPKAVLCVRDEASYQYAINEMGLEKERCLLLPDAALLYRAEKSFVKKEHKILMCLRNDKEQILPLDVKSEIEQFIRSMNYCYLHTSTLTKKVVSLNERRILVEKKIKEFATAQLIITDRLHGMILAFLANTPCIAIDNRTKKVFGVYNAWLSDVSIIQYSHPKADELKKLITQMLTSDSINIEIIQILFKNRYEMLERIITNEF